MKKLSLLFLALVFAMNCCGCRLIEKKPAEKELPDVAKNIAKELLGDKADEVGSLIDTFDITCKKPYVEHLRELWEQSKKALEDDSKNDEDDAGLLKKAKKDVGVWEQLQVHGALVAAHGEDDLLMEHKLLAFAAESAEFLQRFYGNPDQSAEKRAKARAEFKEKMEQKIEEMEQKLVDLEQSFKDKSKN